MNFKKEYEESFSDIKADEEFKKNLVEMMTDEEKHKKQSAYGGVLVAAAVMVFVVGIGLITGILKGKTTQNNPTEEKTMVQNNTEYQSDVVIEIDNEVVAGQQMSDVSVELDISGLSWYGKAESDEELLSVFVSYMDGKPLDAVYVSDAEGMETEETLSREDCDDLVKQLKAARCTKDEFEGECKYYRAVFVSGLSIRFQISDRGYIKLEDTGTVFQLLF